MSQPTHIITLIVHRGDVKDDEQFFLVKHGYSIDSIIVEMITHIKDLCPDATEIVIKATRLRKDSDNDSL